MSEDKTSDPAATACSEDFCRRLLEHAPVAMVSTDPAFVVVTCNAAAGRLIGAVPEDLIGRPLTEAVPEKRRKLLGRLLQRTAERGATSQFQVRLPDAYGKVRDLLVVLSPIPGVDGPAQGVAAWVIDQTHQKRLNERLAKAEKLTSLGTLAGGVAHHFSNILGGVTTSVDFALTSGDTAAMRRALEMTADAAARASQITQSLLTFAERDRRSRDLADLTEVILTFAHLVEHPLEKRQIQLHLDLRPVPIIAVEANLLHQVLNNFLTNSEEAMPDGGTVTIRLEREGPDVKLTFADTGCGIQPQHQPLVFEPFFTTKGLHGGGHHGNPGLGLSVVHGLVTEMGGQILLESQPGEGASFFLTFPLPEPDDEADEG
jgi:PAS domain S-box-containing protein